MVTTKPMPLRCSDEKATVPALCFCRDGEQRLAVGCLLKTHRRHDVMDEFFVIAIEILRMFSSMERTVSQVMQRISLVTLISNMSSIHVR